MKTAEITKKELLDVFELHTARVEMLNNEQITLVKIFQNRPSFRAIAKMAGVNEATIARRLKKIARFISSESFSAALSRKYNVPQEKMNVIAKHFINGLSIRAITQNTGLSVYKIRKIISQMRIL